MQENIYGPENRITAASLGASSNLYTVLYTLNTKLLNVRVGAVRGGRPSDADTWPMLKDDKRFFDFIAAEGGRSGMVRAAATFAMAGRDASSLSLVVPRFALADGWIVEPEVSWVSLTVEPVEVRVVDGRAYALVRVVNVTTANYGDAIRAPYTYYPNAYVSYAYHNNALWATQRTGSPIQLRGLLFAVVDIAACIEARKHERWKFDVTVDLPASGIVSIPLNVFDESFALSVWYDAQKGTLAYSGRYDGVWLTTAHWFADKPMWVVLRKDIKVSVVSGEDEPVRLRLIGSLDTQGKVIYTPIGDASGFIFDARTLNSGITGDNMRVISNSEKGYTVEDAVSSAPWGPSGRSVLHCLEIRLYYGNLLAFHETTVTTTLSGTGGPTGATVPSGSYALVDDRTTEEVTIAEYALNLYSIEFGEGTSLVARKISVPPAASAFSATDTYEGNWDAVIGSSLASTGGTVTESAVDTFIYSLSREGEITPVVTGHISARNASGLYIEATPVASPKATALLGKPVPASVADIGEGADDEEFFFTSYVGVGAIAYADKILLKFDLTQYYSGYADITANVMTGPMEVSVRGVVVHTGTVVDLRESDPLFSLNPLTSERLLTPSTRFQGEYRQVTSSKHYVGDFGGYMLSGYGPESHAWSRDITTQHVDFAAEDGTASDMYGYEFASLLQAGLLRLGNQRFYVLQNGVQDLLTVTLVDGEFAQWASMFSDYLSGRSIGGSAESDAAAWSAAFKGKETPLMSEVCDDIRNSPAMSAHLGHILVERDAAAAAFWVRVSEVRTSLLSREAEEEEKLGNTPALAAVMAGVYAEAKETLRPLYMQVIANEFNLPLSDIELLGFGGYVSGV